jgi:protocatechuate 3,4-dioxygenase beta subunit
MLGYAAVLPGLAVLPYATPAVAALFTPTPAQSRGPFYPLRKPLDQDNDLVVVQGKPGRAQGTLLHVIGRVLDNRGRPVAVAKVEIWQTNAFGRYHHRYDRRDVPLDPHFQGYGHDLTDTEGSYRFRTIQPAAYPASQSWTRPPHIHFAVSGPGLETLVTQMYFAGNPLNARDRLLHSIADPAARASLIVALQPPPPPLESTSTLAVFNLVLRRVS